MKKATIIALLLTSFLSCKKDKVSKDDPILGNWHLVRIYNGLLGGQSPAEWGHTKSCSFAEDNTCAVTLDGITSSKKYTLKQNTLIIDGVDYAVSYLHDTLSLANHPEVDGPIELYVK